MGRFCLISAQLPNTIAPGLTGAWGPLPSLQRTRVADFVPARVKHWRLGPTCQSLSHALPISLSLAGGALTSSLTNRPHRPGLLLVAAATSATAPSQVRGLDRGIRTYAPHHPCPISSPRQPGHSSATRIVRRVAYGCSVTASSTSDRSSSPPRSVLESAEASSGCGGNIRGIGEEGVSTEATEFLTGDPRTRNLGVVPPLPQIRGKINSLRSVLLSSTSSSARN